MTTHVVRGPRFRLPRLRTLWLIGLMAVVGWLVILPLGSVLLGSFRVSPPGVPSPLTLQNYVNAVSSPRFGKAVVNSFLFAVPSTVIAFAIGTYLAWLTERTNVPFRKLIYIAVLVPIVVPGILTSIAWVLIFSDTIGIANHFVAMLGLPRVFSAYTLPAMVWAQASDAITLPFLLMAAAFRVMDPSLEEASATCGAGQRKTMWLVTLPLMAPAALGTLLIVFVKSIDSFEVPAVMGVPGGITVFATEVWLATSRSPVDHNLAAAFAMIYLAFTFGGLYFYYRATNLSAKFATITGKGFRPRRIDLGRRRGVHTTVAFGVLGVAVLLPFLVMVYSALLPFYSVPRARVWGTMSLVNFEWVLTNSTTMRALRNNVLTGFGSSILVMTLAILVSWVVLRTGVRGRRLLDAAAFAPIAVPGIVIGLALVWFYLEVPVPVYATLWIIVIAYATANLPYALRATHASLSQLGRELEEASQTSGANFARTMFSVVLPLISGGLLVGFVYVFSFAFKGLSLPILLAGPGTEILPVLVYDLYATGQYTRLNALGVLMFAFLVLMAVIAQQVAKRLGYETER